MTTATTKERRSFGAWMQAAREDARLSRPAVAEALADIGVTPARVRWWEAGGIPNMVEWAEIVGLYGLDGEDAQRGINRAGTAAANRSVAAATCPTVWRVDVCEI